MKYLVIVESPGKIKTVEKYLGKDYTVLASVGHIMDLPSNKLSIDIENNFKPTYKVSTNKKSVVAKIKKKFKEVDEVLLATDKDREGEMIAWSIAHVLKLKNPKRLLFDSITKEQLQKAVKNPGTIDDRLVDAQKTRRLLDRLLGYKLTPVLWRNVKPNLSTGRVQSVVVRLLIDREKEIEDFFDGDINSFFKVSGNFLNKNDKYSTILNENKKTTKPVKLPTEKSANALLTKCKSSVFTVDNVSKRKSISNPSRPYTTSTLQQDSGHKLGMSVKRTMLAAQHLYEAGLITYMRTDSVHLSKDAISKISEFIKKEYGNQYLRVVHYKAKSCNTQEAHEAVRPTNITQQYVTENTGKKIGSDEKRLYSLIWKRTIASQMSPAEYNVTNMNIAISKETKYVFQSVFKTLLFDGFLKLYKIDDNNAIETAPILKVGTVMKLNDIICDQDYPKPPGRYSEVSLISKLDPETGLNIGRPATYQSIISKIIDNKYANKEDIEGKKYKSKTITYTKKTDKLTSKSKELKLGSETNKLVPTSIGKIVTGFLIKNFPNILDYKFTSNMEDSLDKISLGDIKWVDVLDKFYSKFKPNYDTLMNSKNAIIDKYNKLLGIDDKTGKKVYAKLGIHGPMVYMEGLNYKKGPIRQPLTIDTIKLKDALTILEFPKELGTYQKYKVLLKVSTKTKEKEYYIETGKKTYSAKENTTLKDVEDIIKKTKSNILKELQEGSKTYTVLKGINGWNDYIKISDSKNKKYKANVSLPKTQKIEELDIKTIEGLVEKYYSYKKTKRKYKKKKN